MRRSTALNLDGIFFNSKNIFEEFEPFVNACPVGPGSAFVYDVALDKNQAGTYWYHSELSVQYVDVGARRTYGDAPNSLNTGISWAFDYLRPSRPSQETVRC